MHYVAPDLRALDGLTADVIACAIWEDRRPMMGLAGLLDWRLAGRLSTLAKEGFATGARGEAVLVPGRPRLPFEKVLLLGLGARSAFGDGVFRETLERFLECRQGLKAQRAVLELPGRADGVLDPERAAELALDVAKEALDEDLWLVETEDGEKRTEARLIEERRRVRRV
jgi:hypothetical protein